MADAAASRSSRNGDYQGWWGWLAQHPRSGALADVPFGGLRVRMHNIAIGDQSLVQALWTTRPLAMWCFGEVHGVDPALVPNSQRDDFGPSDALSRLHAQLADEMRRIEKEIRDESKDRNNSVGKITQRAERETTQARRRLEEGLTSFGDIVGRGMVDHFRIPHRTQEGRDRIDEV